MGARVIQPSGSGGSSASGKKYGSTPGRRIAARLSGSTATGSGGDVSTAAAGFASTSIPLARPIHCVGAQLDTPNAIKIPSSVPPGWYDIEAQARIEGGSAGFRQLGAVVSGRGKGIATDSYGGGSFTPATVGKSFLYPGDVVRMSIYPAQATTVRSRLGFIEDVTLTVTSLDLLPIEPTLVGYAGSEVDRPGLPRDIIGTWMNRESWAGMAQGLWLWGTDQEPSGYRTWIENGGRAKASDIGVPLIPHNGVTGGEHNEAGRNDPTTGWSALLDEAISGAQDATYTAMGRKLAEYGAQTVYARLWWEMNQHHASVDPVRFKAAWERAVPLIRAGFASVARPGQIMKIVYCYMASGTGPMDFYPTDESTVDIIAGDIYGALWTSGAPSENQLLLSARVSLDTLAIYAAQHGKPVALGEWGNWSSIGTGTGNYGRGDFPEFIDLVMDWAEQNAAEYLCYFDINGGGTGLDLDDTPMSLERLKERYKLVTP